MVVSGSGSILLKSNTLTIFNSIQYNFIVHDSLWNGDLLLKSGSYIQHKQVKKNAIKINSTFMQVTHNLFLFFLFFWES